VLDKEAAVAGVFCTVFGSNQSGFHITGHYSRPLSSLQWRDPLRKASDFGGRVEHQRKTAEPRQIIANLV
jgi:hypothetical protein